MLLAELVVHHSRPFSPTRRVALGERLLPTEPAPGFGGILLGGIIAVHLDGLDFEQLADLHRLVSDVDHGYRIVQPRLRHRFQTDRVGLAHSRHRLTGAAESFDFEFDTSGSPAQQILGAVYAVGSLPTAQRHGVAGVLHKALRWRGPLGPSFVAHLSGAGGARAWSAKAFADPEAWARQVLGFGTVDNAPSRAEVLARFRARLREVHPDHGGPSEDAGMRILDLTEARRLLLA